MILVQTLLQEKPVKHDNPACEVTDSGTLLIFADRDGLAVSAGYSAGTWVAFRMKGD